MLVVASAAATVVVSCSLLQAVLKCKLCALLTLQPPLQHLPRVVAMLEGGRGLQSTHYSFLGAAGKEGPVIVARFEECVRVLLFEIAVKMLYELPATPPTHCHHSTYNL